MGPAKEKLLREVLDLDDAQAAKARLVAEPEMAAPGVSLADELIADRRAEVREEEAAEAERKGIDSGSAKAGRK